MTSFDVRGTLETALGKKTIFRLDALKSLAHMDRLPYTIKVLLESCLRNLDGFIVTEEAVKGAGEVQRQGRGREGNSVHAGAGGVAGLHGRAVRGGSGGDAGGDGADGGESGESESAGALRSGDRPFGAGGCVWQRDGADDQFAV